MNPISRRRQLHYTAKPAPLPCSDRSFCGGSAPAPPASSKEQNEQNSDVKNRWGFVHQSKNSFVHFMVLFIFAKREQNPQSPISSRFPCVMSFVHTLRVIVFAYSAFLSSPFCSVFSVCFCSVLSPDSPLPSLSVKKYCSCTVRNFSALSRLPR